MSEWRFRDAETVVGSGIRLIVKDGTLRVRLCGKAEPTTADGLVIVECNATEAQTKAAVDWIGDLVLTKDPDPWPCYCGSEAQCQQVECVCRCHL